jgi:hypothetical protein
MGTAKQAVQLKRRRAGGRASAAGASRARRGADARGRWWQAQALACVNGRGVGAQERVWAEASGWRAGARLTQASRHWRDAGARDPGSAALATLAKELKLARAQEVLRWKASTQDAEDGQWPRRVNASSLAREMHEERRARRRGGEAKAATGCDELGGDAVQPGTTSSLHPCGGRGKSNAARVRRAAQDRRWW